MLDSKKLLDGLCAKVGQFKDEVPSAGTKFRLMGLVRMSRGQVPDMRGKK